MKKLLGLGVLLLAAATPASAQSFGEIFPVTNTRYATAFSKPRLSANGRDFFLFWAAERKIRATSLAHDEPRVGHAVLDTGGELDVAWTGEVFVAAATRELNDYANDANIIGRVLDAEARPIGPELALAEHGRKPRIAAGPESVVMVYRTTAGGLRVLALGPRGERTGAESWAIPLGGESYAIAGNDDGFMIALSNPEMLRAILLDRQGRVVTEHSFVRPTKSTREVALATDGNRYLMAWNGENGYVNPPEVAVALLEESGTFGAPFVIYDGHARSLSVVWAGSRWAVSYAANAPSPSPSRARVAHLNRAARTILAEEQSAVTGVSNPTLAAVDERIMAAWNPVRSQSDTSAVIELPFAGHEPRVATYAATQQTLLATASAADATLMVWSEESAASGSTIHTGVRTNNGQWTETELAVTGSAAIAASDGNQFVVIIGENPKKLFRLDEKGRPLAPPVTLEGYDTAIAWNGTHYGIVSDMQGMLLTPAGVLSAPVAIPIPDSSLLDGKLALGSNGDGFLLVGEEIGCIVSICYPIGLNGLRLSAGLQRIEAEVIPIDPIFGDPAGVVWNGAEYVVAWQGDLGFYTARVPATPASPAASTFVYENIDVTDIAPMPDGTVAIVGLMGKSKVTRVAFLRNDGRIAQSFDIDSSTVTGTPFLTTLPDGVAYVVSSVQDAAPHHGTSHVMMAIGRSSVPPPPSPPHVSARLRDGFVLVDWSAPAGTLNGYRLEYRVDGGSWNELEEWFRPSAHHRTIRPSFGTEFEIRMRAFNDGGASTYSETALTKPIRRRAATH